ncbi:RDD family protein [Agilicoccus flavus]|uniref:RDD family protein n=1 Tax=Agilicoccus flavus TaxID=2775968 RepID=UPI001CF64C1C|nr:RDD family protein [Agilicoccus flavus]
MVDRRDIGSWLEGPGARGPQDPEAYPGASLGLPQDGPGSLAPIGRRVLALFIDGAVAQLIARGLLGFELGVGGFDAFKPLLVVFVINVLMVGAGGWTIGHRLLGMRVDACPRGWAGPRRALVRALLLCLAVPPLVVGRDGRGLHDRLAGTVLVRS